MGLKSLVLSIGLGALLATTAVSYTLAQGVPVPPAALPIKVFKDADEHYKYLLDAAHGGTQHTWDSVPKWEGLWSPGGNSMFSLFLVDGTMAAAMAPVDAVVKEGVLTPEYEEAYKARREEMVAFNEQPYDRLTHCEYPGLARWYWEPYVREFVNTPNQSWMFNDFMNESRRIFIGQDHKNVYGTHSSTGDTIGFWNGNRLITKTKYILPADYLRGAPLTSNALEVVDVWEKKTLSNGMDRLEVNVTYYDKHALLKPVTAIYTYNPRPDLDNAGTRIRNWECETTSNSYRDADGNTNYLLPGDAGYKDAGGFTAFPDLPGQSRDPNYVPSDLDENGIPNL